MSSGTRVQYVFITILIAVLCIPLACNLNIYQPVASEASDKSKLEKARTQIDNQDYEGANSTLDDVANDSNDKRLLQTAAQLGASGLNIWTIITDIIDSTTTSSSSSGSVDNIFNQISDAVLGTGDTRTARLQSLVTSINLLKAAPDAAESRVKNLQCFLAGILATPTITEGTTALTAASQALTNISSSYSGTGSSAAECPNLTDLDSSLASISEVQSNFSLILDAAKGCSFLDYGGAAGSLNKIEESLAKFTTNADKGCTATPTCTGVACEALKLGCVQTVINSSPSTAGDGVITSCELTQNCLNPTSCF